VLTRTCKLDDGRILPYDQCVQDNGNEQQCALLEGNGFHKLGHGVIWELNGIRQTVFPGNTYFFYVSPYINHRRGLLWDEQVYRVSDEPPLSARGDKYASKQRDATVQGRLTALLEENGLWPDEAEAVIELLKAATPDMSERWEDGLEHYPQTMFAVLWMSAQFEAAEWLAKNKPEHFARAFFAD